MASASTLTVEAAAMWKLLHYVLLPSGKQECSEEARETLGVLGQLESMHGSTGPRDIAHNITSERQGPWRWVLCTHLRRLSIYFLSLSPATQGTYGVKE